MAGIQVPTVSAALTADSTVDGIVTVADSKPFWPGAEASITNATGEGVDVIIVEEPAAGKLRCMVLDRSRGAVPRYGGSDLRTFTLVGSFKLTQPAQMVYDRPGFGVVPRIPAILKTT